jgi:hypothetical protein
MIGGAYGAFRPAFWQYHIDIVIINFRVEKCGVYIQVIDVPSTSPDQRDEISKGSLLSNRSICLTEISLLIAFDNYACLVTCRPIVVSLSLEDPSGANWLHKRLLGFFGVDCGEGVVQEDGTAFFIYGSLPVISKWSYHSFGICRWVPINRG